MPEPLSIWIGKVELEGIPSEPRRDVVPPPHWRLEAVAATERPRSLTLGADRATGVFILDRDTSDLWLLTLDGRPPGRLTTGRDPQPYWEDTTPVLSPDGTRAAYGDQGAVWMVPTRGGPAIRVADGSSPVWVDDARLVIGVERGDATRLAVCDVDDPWPQRLARIGLQPDELGDEWGAAVAPGGASVAYVFTPRSDLRTGAIRVADVSTGAVRELSRVDGQGASSPSWSPDGTTIAFVSERSGWNELHLVAADGSSERQLTADGTDFSEPEWHADGSRLVAVRCRRNRFDLVAVDARSGNVTVLCEGGLWSRPHWTAAGDVVAAYEDHATPPSLRLVGADGTVDDILAPVPRAVRNAPHARPEEVVFAARDGLELHGFLYRPRTASRDACAPVIVYPHGGPTSYYGDEWDGHAQYFVDKGYGWLAVNYRGSTGYGREFERRNHGDWGIGDTQDCLAAADHLRTLDWVDPDRLGIFGSSYGSYLALLAVTDDPERRFRCAVCKYGDCDILTSWAQGDREGVQDMMRQMPPPARAREAYRAGSPVHRLEHVTVPLLVAHGALDARVSPRQSEELVAELKRIGGKTFEYVTYPTEAHGFLRAGPQIDFYRRLERFLDWYLM